MERALQAVADPTRRCILDLLAEGDLAAGEIARSFPEISRPAVSQHLAVLREAGLVRERRVGRRQEEGLVTLTLHEVEGGTELILSHEGFADAGVAENHRQGWADCIDRLVGLAPAVDREIRFETYIEASSARVWRAVESQEMIRRWLGKQTEFEPGLGGRVRVFDSSGEWVMGGEVIEWEPGRRMTFTWAGLEPTPHAPTRFTFELIPQREGTRVVLRHHYFLDAPESDYLDYQQGWGTGEPQLAAIAAIAVG